MNSQHALLAGKVGVGGESNRKRNAPGKRKTKKQDTRPHSSGDRDEKKVEAAAMRGLILCVRRFGRGLHEMCACTR